MVWPRRHTKTIGFAFDSQSHFSIKGSGSFFVKQIKGEKAFYIFVYSMTKKCYNYNER